MIKEMHDALLQGDSYLHEESRLSFKQGLRSLVSYCLQKGKLLLIGTDALFLMLFLLVFTPSYGDKHIVVVALLTVIWMFQGYINGLYNDLLSSDAEIVVRKTLKHWMVFVIMASFLYGILLYRIFDYKGYYLGLLLVGITVFVCRVLFLTVRKKYKTLIVKKRKIVIIGSNGYSNLLENYIKKGFSNYHIHRWYQNDAINLYATEQVHSDIYHLEQHGVAEIYCCLSAFNKADLQQLLSEADKYMIRVKFLPDFQSVFNKAVNVEKMGNIPVVSVRSEPLLFDRNKVLKRAFDICFSLLVIVFLLSWLIPLIGLIIKLESKGPLFFKQKRSGIDNRPFFCYKFRSMVSGNKTADKQQATKNDARITKVGAFLRKTSLDELPQFFNVLLGDMSVVGPRPHMLSHTNQYRKEVGTYMIRHLVKPGITGWAQVNGYRGETKDLSAMENRVSHDVTYVETWTFLLDMKIIFLTVWNIVRGEENAY